MRVTVDSPHCSILGPVEAAISQVQDLEVVSHATAYSSSCCIPQAQVFRARVSKVQGV